MSEEEKFDAIIIGAGPAGIACAYLLAKAQKNVLVIERGVTAGSKNVTGGRLYTYALEMVEEGLTKAAEEALERKVVREQITMMDGDKAITIDYHDLGFKGDVPQSYTILRAVFDEWFAAQAEAEGAMIATGIRVDDVIEKDGRIIGVKAGEDEMYADVVIAADGVNSLIAQKAGLRGELPAHSVGVGVKEIIELPPKTIEERFNVGPDEGVAKLSLGCTEGIQGGGFLYTNKDSVSLGVVFSPEQAAKNGKKIHEIFQDYKMSPAIYPLIGDGTTTEYGAHLVPEEGLRGVPKKLFRDGLVLVGDAAGFGINMGYIIRGIDLALVSGAAAAKAIIAAEKVSDVGPAYMKELDNMRLIPNMKAVAGFPDILTLPRIFSTYPKMANDVFQYLFTVDGKVPTKMTKALMGIVKKHVTMGQLMGDAWRGLKSI
ncbi:MAG: FAD-dependent oxidoreductase [Heliobacteriaceae bacterium]|nr:FAD-dependent oxidoreductase [Heliobacteriaceae bacterium]